MSNKVELPSNWVCDGMELNPKTGASSTNTWVCDGKELKPKTSASSSNTWLIDGQKAKPKTGANSSNTYDIGRLPILAVAGQLVLRLW